MGASRTTLTNARLLTPDGFVDGWLGTEDGAITGLGAGAPPAGAGAAVDAGGRTVLPGTVDTHIHGGAGAAFTETDPERLRSIVEFNRANGATTLVGGLVAATPEDTLDQVRALADLADEGLIAGMFLEGPWISPDRHGAHDPALLRDPDTGEFDALLKASRGHLRMVTVAPELPGALKLVAAAASQGVTVAVGHTEATYDQARAAFDAGARVATHLYNAMRPFNHREPGPIGAALTDERVTLELINDGVHVHPAAAQVAFEAAGGDRVSLVTDAMAATGLGDGEYTLGKLRVRVSGGEARLVEDGTIASSTIVLPDAVRRAVETVEGVDLATAARSATSVPARALGIEGVGELAEGYRADLVVLDDDLSVAGVMYRGAWVRKP
ncbi:N-acetylglucosamine-6-phosphate deacetylase [Nocardiopsis chromatogenes]|uniref:N-acetylglucosamine-6-phosphate deacetylase n=1 Tax=Nocardiopsis chromatogenes TaxID=280239 RepID=UPI000344D8E0|nr:N-acetylglucosamine-6-phosphate deacetylase [Nocardiopsis chromatogenes]